MTKRATCLILAILCAGCTSSSSSSSSEPTSTTSATTESTTATTEPTGSTTGSSSETAAQDPTAAAEPLRAYDDDPPAPVDQVETSAYITRAAMSAASIELVWAMNDGASEYHLHRIPLTSDQQPDVASMTDENRIHIADEPGRFIDDGVEAGTRYWYGVRSLADDGALVAHGWHRADAVTDPEPPSTVGPLDANVRDGEVLITWTKPNENYELHGYRVLRGLDGADPEPVSTTWDTDQTSFLDDDLPAAGTVTYAIVAFDFHWNDSAPAEIDVELSE